MRKAIRGETVEEAVDSVEVFLSRSAMWLAYSMDSLQVPIFTQYHPHTLVLVHGRNED